MPRQCLWRRPLSWPSALQPRCVPAACALSVTRRPASTARVCVCVLCGVLLFCAAPHWSMLAAQQACVCAPRVTLCVCVCVCVRCRTQAWRVATQALPHLTPVWAPGLLSGGRADARVGAVLQVEVTVHLLLVLLLMVRARCWCCFSSCCCFCDCACCSCSVGDPRSTFAVRLSRCVAASLHMPDLVACCFPGPDALLDSVALGEQRGDVSRAESTTRACVRASPTQRPTRCKSCGCASSRPVVAVRRASHYALE